VPRIYFILTFFASAVYEIIPFLRLREWNNLQKSWHAKEEEKTGSSLSLSLSLFLRMLPSFSSFSGSKMDASGGGGFGEEEAKSKGKSSSASSSSANSTTTLDTNVKKMEHFSLKEEEEKKMEDAFEDRSEEKSKSFRMYSDISEEEDEEANLPPLSSETDPLVVLKRISFGWQFALVDFALFKRVGGGRYSAVYHAKYKRLGMDMALKRYVRERLQPHSMEQIAREIAIHSQMQHASIAPFYGAFLDEHTGDIYLIHEFAHRGDVFNALNATTFGRFSETRAAREVIKPLVNAVVYLHQRGVVHRDIKPENILVAEAGSTMVMNGGGGHGRETTMANNRAYARYTAKLTDFGFACDLNVHKPLARLGTTDYMAPEVVACNRERREELQQRNESGYGAAVDNWAIGVLTYELLVGIPPFAGPNSPNREDMYERILKGAYSKIPSFVSDKAKDFITRCLEVDPEKRATAEELLEHEWLVSRTMVRHSGVPTSPTPTDGKTTTTTVKSTTKAQDDAEEEHETATLSRKTIPSESKKEATNNVDDATSDGDKNSGEVFEILKEQIKIANEINKNAVAPTTNEIEEIVEESAKNVTEKKKDSVGSEEEPWSSSDESLENEENYVRELASIAAGRSASIAIAGISGSGHHSGGGGLYSTHVPTSQLSLMKEKTAAAAPISPLKQPIKAPLPPSSPTDAAKKSSDNAVEGLGFGAQKIDLAGLAALRARYAGEEYESNTSTPARSSYEEQKQIARKTKGDIHSSPSISMFGKLMQRSQSAIMTKSSSHPEAMNGGSSLSPRKKKSTTTSLEKSANNDGGVQRSSQSFLQRMRGSFFSSRRMRNLTVADGQSEFDDRNIKT